MKLWNLGSRQTASQEGRKQRKKVFGPFMKCAAHMRSPASSHPISFDSSLEKKL